MAHLYAEIKTYSNGQPDRAGHHSGKVYRLGEDQAEAILTTQSGTAVKVTLFADGSGLLKITRGNETSLQAWSPEDAAGLELDPMTIREATNAAQK